MAKEKTDRGVSLKFTTKGYNKLRSFVNKNKQYSIGGYAEQATLEKIEREQKTGSTKVNQS